MWVCIPWVSLQSFPRENTLDFGEKNIWHFITDVHTGGVNTEIALGELECPSSIGRKAHSGSSWTSL